MKYTNGFDIDLVLPALRGRVGWRSETDKVVAFEGFHPLVSEDNLKAVQPKADITNTAFAALKAQMKDDVILKALRNVFSKPENLEIALLHSRYPGSATTLIPNTGRFCGLQLTIQPTQHISAVVKQVNILLNGAATFKLYLFREGTDAPLKSLEVTTETGMVREVLPADWILSYRGSMTHYLGYFQDDLGAVQAIREDITANRSNHFVGAPCEVLVSGAERIRYDAASVLSSGTGINAEVHAFRDYTPKIIHSAHLFDEVIGLQMQYQVLETIVSTVRSNEIQRILGDTNAIMELKHQLYGVVTASAVAKTKGLNEQIQEKYTALRKSFFPDPKMRIAHACR
jgi:hypothetical protein